MLGEKAWVRGYMYGVPTLHVHLFVGGTSDHGKNEGVIIFLSSKILLNL